MAIAKTQSPRPNGASPRTYSPSRQLLDAQRLHLDLEEAFVGLRIRDAEVEKLHAYQRRVHKDEADAKESGLAKQHALLLEKAQKERDAVREEAEATLQRHLHEQQEELKRRQEEERLRQEREAQAKAERDRKIKEEQEKLEREKAESERAEAERKQREKERADQAERDRRRKEDERRQQQEEKQQQDAARQQAETAAQQKADQQAQAAATDQATSPDKIHKEYLDLYFKLKKWKNDFWTNARKAKKEHKNDAISASVSEARSIIKSEVGKLSNGDKEINRMATNKLKTKLSELLLSPMPVVGTLLSVNDLLPPSLNLNDNGAAKISDQAAYFLMVLSQQVVKIFISYVHSQPERAEPIGVMLTSIFAQPQLQFQRHGSDLPQTRQTQSLFPIFLAKYHRVCPALFGITAPQSTSQGKQRLGWALNPAQDEDQPKTTFVKDQDHYDRMTGLAIGYSSFGLRNFSAAQNLTNPYPPTNFWRSLAQILNLPPGQVQPTHVCVLRHIFGSGGIQRFLLFYGNVGVAVLREAYIEFPKRLPPGMQKDSFTKELLIFAEGLGEKEHLHLT